MKPRLSPLIALAAFALLFAGPLCGKASARQWVVAKSGNDSAFGTAAKPFVTIGRAAQMAQPGDTVLIHAGVYREQVALPRGGTSDKARITFAAAPGEDVVVKGSEPITNWQREAGNIWQRESPGIWRADVPDSQFPWFYPFATLISGPGYMGDSWHHLGAVYIGGEALAEQPTPEAVVAGSGRWYAKNDGAVTHIWANFGDLNPADPMSLVEINVRPAAFVPASEANFITIDGRMVMWASAPAAAPAVNYITIDGLTISQTANNWASPDGPQPGAISTGGGTHWIIRNCTITDAKCVAISLEQPTRDLTRTGPNRPAFGEFDNIAAVGHHIVTNNLIQHCGEAGIFGVVHGTDSQITGNQIEDINASGQFSGDDVAGIRLADAVDTIIGGNLIRRIHGAGIVLGPLYQGVRITGNVIADTTASPLHFFHSHGPALVDHNIIAGPGAATGEGINLLSAEANVFAHNLFADCAFTSDTLPPFIAGGTISFLPHSLVTKQTIPSIALDNKWFNNIFIRGGLDRLPQHAGDEADFNACMAGAAPARWADAHSATVTSDGRFALNSRPGEFVLRFKVSAVPPVQAPVIDADFIGRFALTEGIEQPNGDPIHLLNDFFGQPNPPGAIGPFASAWSRAEMPLFTLHSKP